MSSEDSENRDESMQEDLDRLRTSLKITQAMVQDLVKKVKALGWWRTSGGYEEMT